MAGTMNPLVAHDLPSFITGPGETDVLFYLAVVFVVSFVMILGNLYLRLHSMPERMAHRSQKIQLELVAVLGLVSLFTHNHLFWIAGLILAFIEVPDFATPIGTMARSLERMADRTRTRTKEEHPPSPAAQPNSIDESAEIIATPTEEPRNA